MARRVAKLSQVLAANLACPECGAGLVGNVSCSYVIGGEDTGAICDDCSKVFAIPKGLFDSRPVTPRKSATPQYRVVSDRYAPDPYVTTLHQFKRVVRELFGATPDLRRVKERGGRVSYYEGSEMVLEAVE